MSKKQELRDVRIRTGLGDETTRGYDVGGEWAVTQYLDDDGKPSGLWTITHVPSGLCVASRVKGARTKVERVARAVAERFPTFDPKNTRELAALLDELGSRI